MQMRKAVVFGVLMAMAAPAVPALAATKKEQDCAYQGQVVEAVRQARIARVSERKVPEHVAASGPGWPEQYSAAVPLVTPWVYEMKMRDVKAQDLAAAWVESCLSQ